jgi:RNA polymerase sigma-70 factor (ECF subfamily)
MTGEEPSPKIGDDRSFCELMRAVSAGSDAAATELLNRFGPAVISAVRKSLDRRMRSKFDSLDFAQAVWTSFFASVRTRQPFRDPEELVAFLAKVAQHKVCDEFRRRLRSGKYDVQRESSLDAADGVPPEQFAAPQATPSQVAIEREWWCRLLEGQSDRDRKIITLRAEGLTCKEVSTRLGIDERTVRRVIKKIFESRVR